MISSSETCARNKSNFSQLVGTKLLHQKIPLWKVIEAATVTGAHAHLVIVQP